MIALAKDQNDLGVLQSYSKTMLFRTHSQPVRWQEHQITKLAGDFDLNGICYVPPRFVEVVYFLILPRLHLSVAQDLSRNCTKLSWRTLHHLVDSLAPLESIVSRNNSKTRGSSQRSLCFNKVCCTPRTISLPL